MFTEVKLKLLKILKTSFENDELGGAFDSELKVFLEPISPMDIPDNLTSFYYTNIQNFESFHGFIIFYLLFLIFMG